MSKSSRFYRPELDVLRCLAFLLVFFHHATLFPNGWLAVADTAGALGVCLFFFLSAFLITQLLEREQASTGTLHFRAFYARRILRIWPLYFAILLLDFLSLNLRRPGTFTGGRLLAFTFLAGNWFVAHHGFTWSLSTPLWSISVEEQFYVLWPTVRRFTGRLGSVIFSALVLALAYVALFVLCRQGTDPDTAIWVNSFVQFQFFAAGSLLAMYLRDHIPSIPAYLRGLLLGLGLGAFFCAQNFFHIKSGMPRSDLRSAGLAYLLANLGCFALFLSFFGASVPQLARPLIYLGKISYGLYAFHWAFLSLFSRLSPHVVSSVPTLAPFAAALKSLVAFAATVVVASASYRFFEAPILRYKRRFEVIQTRPA